MNWRWKSKKNCLRIWMIMNRGGSMKSRRRSNTTSSRSKSYCWGIVKKRDRTRKNLIWTTWVREKSLRRRGWMKTNRGGKLNMRGGRVIKKTRGRKEGWDFMKTRGAVKTRWISLSITWRTKSWIWIRTLKTTLSKESKSSFPCLSLAVKWK